MKILIPYAKDCLWRDARKGYVDALRDCGFSVDDKPKDDTIYDVCITSCMDRPNIDRDKIDKLIVHVPPLCGYHVPKNIMATSDHENWVCKHDPDIFFGFGSDCDLDLWSYWTNKKVLMLHKAANAVRSVAAANNVTKSNKKDYLYYGDCEVRNSHTVEAFMRGGVFKLKSVSYSIFTNLKMNNIRCSEIDNQSYHEQLRSHKYVICAADPGCYMYGINISGHVFDALYAGVPVVHTATNAFRDEWDVVEVVHNSDDMVNTVKQLSAVEYSPYRKNCGECMESVRYDTYHDRCADLFDAMHMGDQAEYALRSKPAMVGLS